jgi:hypothetical protein
MNEHSVTSEPPTPISADDPQRPLKIARPNTDQSLPHIGLVGDTYTVLLSGNDTNGRYCLIDMHIPPSGGPPPTGTTSMNRLLCWKARSRPRSEANNRLCGRVKP